MGGGVAKWLLGGLGVWAKEQQSMVAATSGHRHTFAGYTSCWPPQWWAVGGGRWLVFPAANELQSAERLGGWAASRSTLGTQNSVVQGVLNWN